MFGRSSQVRPQGPEAGLSAGAGSPMGAGQLLEHEERSRHLREMANPRQDYSPREIKASVKKVNFSTTVTASSAAPTAAGPVRRDSLPNLTSPLSPKNALQATINMTSRLVPTRKVDRRRKGAHNKRSEKLMRAYNGTILAIIERPKSRGCLLITLNFVYPFLSILIDFLQFNIIISGSLSDNFSANSHSITDRLSTIVFFDLWISFLHFPFFYIALGMVVGLFTVLGIMALQFGVQGKQHHRIFVNVLASYVSFVSGVSYIPLVNLLSIRILDNLRSLHSDPVTKIASAVGIGVVILLFVPFCVFYSQNSGYIGDEFAFHLRKRRHSRMEMLLILIKTLAVFGRSLGRSWARVILNFVLFLILFMGHFFTAVYYITKLNYLYTGLYFCLVSTAVANLVHKCVGHQSAKLDNAYFWYCIPVLLLAGVIIQYYSYSWLCIYHLRFKINLFLMNSFQNLDLADNPEVIHRFELASLLHTATRLGKYARFLATLDPQDRRPEAYFLRALEQEPNHCEILGWYAEYLAKQEGRSTDADIFYQRAIMAGPNHRDNLEGYAWFLRQKNTPESLFYYQRALLQYYEHFEYRDMYANSPDPMMIMAQDGTIVDVNGASMYFFCTVKRKQLCNFKTTIFELTCPDHVERFKAKINEVVWEAFHSKFECRMKTYLDKAIFCEVVLTRMKHHRRSMIHVALNDRTEIHKLLDKTALLGVVHKLSSQAEHRELSRLLFENSLTVQIMAVKKTGIIERFNDGAEVCLGVPRTDVIGKHISTIIPQKIMNEFEADVDHEHGESREGFTRDIEVTVGDGTVKPFMVKLALFNVGGNVYIFASMVDVSRYINSRPCFPTAQQRNLIIARSPRAMESASMVNLLFQFTPAPIFMIDEVGIIARVNPRALTEFGYTTEEMVGKNITILMPADMQRRKQPKFRKFLSMPSHHQWLMKGYTVKETPFQCKDGTVKMCILEMAELGGGSRTYYVGVIHGSAPLPPFVALDYANDADGEESSSSSDDDEADDLEAGRPSEKRPLMSTERESDPFKSVREYMDRRRSSDMGMKPPVLELPGGGKRGSDGSNPFRPPPAGSKPRRGSRRFSRDDSRDSVDMTAAEAKPRSDEPPSASKLGISSWGEKDTKVPVMNATFPMSAATLGKALGPSPRKGSGETVSPRKGSGGSKKGGVMPMMRVTVPQPTYGASSASSVGSDSEAGANSPPGTRRISVPTLAKAVLSLTPKSKKGGDKKASTMLSAEKRSAMTPQQLEAYERTQITSSRGRSSRNTALRRSSRSGASGGKSAEPETAVSLEQQKKILETLNKGKEDDTVVNDSSAAALALLGHGIVI